MNTANYQITKDEILKLIKNDMITSAELLCSLLLSSLSTDNKITPSIYSEIYELFGDILFEKGEIKRSLNNYNASMQQLKLCNLSINLQKNKVYNRMESQSTIENNIEANIRYKEVKCLLKLNETTQALSDLEAIPSNLRTTQILMILGKLYKNNNRKKDAIKIYKEVISILPTCIEAFEALVSLGIDMVEFKTLLDDSKKGNQSDCLFYDGWLHSYISGLILKRNNEFEKSEAHFLHLISIFPKNINMLTELGKIANDSEKPENSIVLYKQIRRLDKYYLTGMDLYAFLLKSSLNSVELNKLTHDCLSISQTSPISWCIVALNCDLKGEYEKSLQFINKAIELDSKYSNAFRFKGYIQLAHDHADQAIISFYQANTIDRDISSFLGLIQANLALGKIRDAVHVAKDALVTLPKSSIAHLIMGDLLARTPESYNDACHSYGKSLKINPLNKAAIAAQSNIYIIQGKLKDAESLLKISLNRITCYKLRTLYAKVLVAMSRYTDAIEQLHLSISLNPEESIEATVELERLERILQQENSGLQ